MKAKEHADAVYAALRLVKGSLSDYLKTATPAERMDVAAALATQLVAMHKEFSVQMKEVVAGQSGISVMRAASLLIELDDKQRAYFKALGIRPMGTRLANGFLIEVMRVEPGVAHGIMQYKPRLSLNGDW